MEPKLITDALFPETYICLSKSPGKRIPKGALMDRVARFHSPFYISLKRTPKGALMDRAARFHSPFYTSLKFLINVIPI
jgi:hypothetical protein